MNEFRIEKDAMGEVEIPGSALWGASTQRAIDNFPISGRTLPIAYIQKLALIKKIAAETNARLGILDKKIACAIFSSASEIIKGNHNDQFPIDVFQTGSGTSTNMNLNEVIANLANLQLGGKTGLWKPVHPNDHVNMCQSSNDVMPSALHVAAAVAIKEILLPAMKSLHKSLLNKSKKFRDIKKIGRTHLMDAVPMTLGQEFSGWARQIERCISIIKSASNELCEIALGGTALGTGLGAHPKFSKRVCKDLSKITGIEFMPAKNAFEAISWRGPSVAVSGALKTFATALYRTADDIRLLASGPRLGFSEIELPALQPGSSMMPGKVNPVIPEMACQVANHVIGNDAAITAAAMSGHLELNTQLPLVAINLLESIEVLSAAAKTFAKKCIDGIVASENKCRKNIEMSLAMATALVPQIGYATASEIAKKAYAEGKSIREITAEMNILSARELDAIFDIDSLINRGQK
jgi:fumarate hydratase class II